MPRLTAAVMTARHTFLLLDLTLGHKLVFLFLLIVPFLYAVLLSFS